MNHVTERDRERARELAKEPCRLANVGGNILDSDIDFQVNLILTGMAVAR